MMSSMLVYLQCKVKLKTKVRFILLLHLKILINYLLELENLPDQPLNEITSTTHDQLSEGLLTLSTMPRTRWQTLLNLDTIKERNKPVEPPKAPEKTPFFLSSMMEANNNNNMNMEIDTKEDSHRLEQGATGLETPLTSILKSQDSDKRKLLNRL